MPVFYSATGKAQVSVIICKSRAKWNIQNYLKVLVLYMAIKNIKSFKSAVVFIKNNQKKISCRYHIFEIMLRSTFEENMG